MSWKDLPILPLCRIYEFLSIKDCLSASSCCKQWRHAFKFHRTERVQLCLKVNSENIEKNLFLADLNRNVKDLKIILASSIDEYTRFTSIILKRFWDYKNLAYITYVPTLEYLTFERTHNKDFVQRILLTPLLQFCELPCIKGVNINGCTELAAHASTILQTIRYPKYFKILGLSKLRSSSFISVPLNVNLFNGFISLACLSLDYSYISEELLVGMKNRMPALNKLILNITDIPEQGFHDMTSCWLRLREMDHSSFTVTINCIRLSPDSLNDINNNVLSEALPLEVLRVMFCESINIDILRKLINYNDTLKELVWIDSLVTGTLKSGINSIETRRRTLRRSVRNQLPNPLVMMCWQCYLLEKITLHGYWHSADDLLGMARLRGTTLQSLDVSALLPPVNANYPKQPFTSTQLSYEDILSNGPYIPDGFTQKMKAALMFPWHAPNWSNLHSALKNDPEENINQVEEYVISFIQQDIPSIEETSLMHIY